MRITAPRLLLLSLLAAGCGGTHASAPPAAILPLTSVRLYETGLGYFERSGTLSPSQRTTSSQIPFFPSIGVTITW